MLAASLDSLHDRMSRGTVGLRGAYAAARALARARTVVRRRRALRTLADPAAPTIPEDDGYLVVPAETLAARGTATGPVVEIARRLRAATDTSPETDLWEKSEGRNLLRVPLEPRLAEEPEWLALALDPVLLSTAARYLGQAPLLTVAQLWISPFARHSPDGRRLEHRYHCDWASVRQVRALVFVEDVTPDHGPLTVIPARESAAVRRSRDYTFGEAECTILDEDLFAHVSRDSERRLTGPAGTLAFADTCRCFHQGSRVLREGIERVMVMFQYMPVTAFKVGADFVRRSPFADLASDGHTPLQRLALGALPQ